MDKYNIYVTDHAYDRMRERFRIKKDSAYKMAIRAWEQGLKLGDLTGRLHRYVLSKIKAYHDKATHVRIYGELVYVFCRNQEGDMILVTVYGVPQDLKASAIGRQKKELNQ